MSPSGVLDHGVSRFAAVLARAADAPTALILLTGDGDGLILAGASGMPPEWPRPGNTPSRSTLAGLVLETGEPLIITDIRDDPRVPDAAPAVDAGVRGYAGFPIHHEHDGILGVCNVIDYQPRDWTPDQLAAVDEAAQACAEFVAGQHRADTQRRFLDALLRSLKIGVAACDENGNLVFQNDYARELSGRIPVGTPIRDWAPHSRVTDLHGRPLPADDLPLLRALRGERLRDTDLLVNIPGGHPRTITVDAQPIIGAGRHHLGSVVTVRDVTEQRRAGRFRDVDQAVTEALANAGSIQEAGPPVLAAICDGFGWPYGEIWLVDQEAGTLLPAAHHHTGSPDIGNSATCDPNTEFDPGDTVTDTAWRTGRTVWAGHEPGTDRVRLAVPAPTGSRVLAVLSFRATAVDDPADPLISLLAGIGARIAEFLERHRADELTLALHRSKDDYLALIGHELRTPLTSITAYVEMLRESDPDTVVAELPGMLDVLSRNSAILRTIVDQLLDLAALDGGHATLTHRPVDLAAVIRAADAEVHPAAEAAQVSVKLDLQVEPTVTGDAARLRQVVTELLGNAIKHTLGAGEVTVRMTRPDPAAVELTVTDTGLGVPHAEHDRLFARFYRSARTRENRIPGNGLGLALSRAIVNLHHGSIRVVPTSGPGTKITVRLPADRSEHGG
ncbi:signal transduction histidine kinase [Actinoplanes italicus]|uniref:histidine kinase n=2 Tax=Actinoplanes italicus TaxID=113567 RepID=A0A2T0K9A8_9ACTN|nr:signal transduction histidine kinase [Actinoplanes italicus]